MASYWIIYSFLILGSGVLCDRELERLQAVSSCSGNTDDSYHCSKNMCIDWMSVCDGYVDCSDGSDEDNDMCGRYDYETNMAMDCGKVRTKNQVISNNGSMEALVGNAPWYARIFSFDDGNYTRLCGVTIIAPNVVISEAYNFWEEGIKSMKTSINNSQYIVNVGKDDMYIMRVDQIKDLEFHQKMNVETIYLPEGYKDDNADIAIIVLADKIPFRDGLAAPVCIDWRNKYGVFNGDQGKVVVYNLLEAGMRYKDEYTYFEKNSSYVNSITCKKIYPDLWSEVTSYDKFCAERKSDYKNLNSELKKLYGLWGGGITFLHSNSYFLTGVSTRNDGFTNKFKVQQFIDIKFYVHWIRGIINKHVRKYVSLY